MPEKPEMTRMPVNWEGLQAGDGTRFGNQNTSPY